MPSSTPEGQIRVLLTITFVTVLAQMSLSPVIAPLARTLALSAAAVATALFAVVSGLGMTGVLGGFVLFLLFLLFRGIFFGAAMAAVPPTAQAAIADATTGADGAVDADARVKGMARLGATQGVGQVLGSAVGGLLAVFGLMVPLIAVPVLLALAVLLIRTRLRPQPPTELVRRPRTVSPGDRRVLPFLLCGFGMYLALGFIQIIIGFLVQDRLGVLGDRAGLLTGLALLTAGAGVVTAQVVIVPRIGRGPGALLRIGAVTATVGFVLLVPGTTSTPLTAVLLYIGVGVIALGMGTATPGFTAGASLQVEREEQGGVAGLVTATMGLTMVLAPTLGTVLYGFGVTVPVTGGAVVTGLVALGTVVSPRLRHTPTAIPEA